MTARLAWSFLRLFTVQGSWNYDRMIGVGVGLAEEPLLRELARTAGPDAYRAAVGRGGHFFNAHPYLAGMAVGALARLEDTGAAPEQVERLRAALCGPLGSLGDRLVWAGWLPLVSGLALAALALGVGWPAVVGFLALYNLGHVALRWWALRAGWTHGAQVAAALHAPWMQFAARAVAPAMACAVGLALPLAAGRLARDVPVWAGGAVVGVAVGGFLLLTLRRERWDGLRYGLVVTALALIVGVVVW